MNVEIIAVGTEILLGDIANTDAQMISKKLAEIGLNVFYHTVVGDNPKRLEDILENAKKRADIIITTGGLGPTYDDLTKEIICKSFNKDLILDNKALEDIEVFFEKLGRTMTENNKKQALVPENAVVFYNKWGTAPGFSLSKDEKTVMMFPGVPKEMKKMFDYYAKPLLKSGDNGTIFSTNIHLYGVSECYIESLLVDLMEANNPTVAPYAKTGEVTIRVSCLSKNQDEAQQEMKPIIQEILHRCKEFPYAMDKENIQYYIEAAWLVINTTNLTKNILTELIYEEISKTI